MSNDNRELNNNELNKEEFPEGVTELSMEDLEQVSGGVRVELRGAMPTFADDYQIVKLSAEESKR